MIRIAVVPVEEVRPAALPIRYKQVKEAVVVIVCPGAPGGVAAVVDEAAGRDFAERAVAVVVVERVVLAAVVRGKQIEPAIVVEIAPTAAEATVQRGSRVCQLCERAIAVVAIEEILRAAVANE